MSAYAVKRRPRHTLHCGHGPTMTFRLTGAVAVSMLLTAALFACAAGDEDPNTEESVLQLEAKVQSLEESLEALSDENAALNGEIAELQEGLKDRDTRIAELEEVTAKLEFDWSDKEEWSNGKDEKSSMPEGTAVERTTRLAEEFGGKVHYVDHPGRGDLTVLVTPQDFTDGETPLIVSLHGFGGDSADHSAYVPLHERVNTDGFALLLPNGILNPEGSRFWNPTDECCSGGKSGEDDVAYLTGLVAEAQKIMDFGPVYFFGYSNGGFMAHHMACKGLPGLRAVASLAGTSYVEDAACDGSPAVSVLHIHGTGDGVILFDGVESAPDPKGAGEKAFYLGARDMVDRWSRQAGCDWPDNPQPYTVLDLDEYVPGSETQAFRLESGCGPGITIELWTGEGSGHAPAYGDTFVDALLGWLLAQE